MFEQNNPKVVTRKGHKNPSGFYMKHILHATALAILVYPFGIQGADTGQLLRGKEYIPESGSGSSFKENHKKTILTESTVVIDQSKGIMLSNGEDGLDSNLQDKKSLFDNDDVGTALILAPPFSDQSLELSVISSESDFCEQAKTHAAVGTALIAGIAWAKQSAAFLKEAKCEREVINSFTCTGKYEYNGECTVYKKVCSASYGGNTYKKESQAWNECIGKCYNRSTPSDDIGDIGVLLTEQFKPNFDKWYKKIEGDWHKLIKLDAELQNFSDNQAKATMCGAYVKPLCIPFFFDDTEIEYCCDDNPVLKCGNFEGTCDGSKTKTECKDGFECKALNDILRERPLEESEILQRTEITTYPTSNPTNAPSNGPTPPNNGRYCRIDSECDSGRCSLSSSTCEDKLLPNGERCLYDEDCVSGRCSALFQCEDKVSVGDGCLNNDDCQSNICEWRSSCPPNVKCCVSAPEALMPNEARCTLDSHCNSGRCSSSFICEDKLPNGESCGENEDCVSNYCPWFDSSCGGIGCCKNPPGLPNGSLCVFDYQCLSGRCSSPFFICEDKLPNGESCGEDEDCESNYCPWSLDCGSIVMGCCEEVPPPPPPSPSPKPKCFSSETLVTHSERGLIPISEIEVGDYVLDSKLDGSFSRVFALEQNHYGESAFYQLLSSTGTLLELTDRHMVYLRNKALPVPAIDIQDGDVLKSDDPKDDMEVVKINVIHRDGYYNPVTESGRIVLNDGVVASSFSVAKSSSSKFFDASTELIHWHTLSHMANAPLRFVCKAISFNLCSDEKHQNEQGLHKFVVLLKCASLWIGCDLHCFGAHVR